jgi:hypothetical protein
VARRRSRSKPKPFIFTHEELRSLPKGEWDRLFDTKSSHRVTSAKREKAQLLRSGKYQEYLQR